MNGKMFDI